MKRSLSWAHGLPQWWNHRRRIKVFQAAIKLGPIRAYYGGRSRRWMLDQRPCEPADIIAAAERRAA